ncbi:lipopolysaccharide biosynthesis protein [Winogradskyella sp. R77965]|uniref:lipopolysaccharide biosynthesis protein n=1 Tax=Winogradskyella sp. R77965 TaxID=3093872 RepID=UPI0037DD2E94
MSRVALTIKNAWIALLFQVIYVVIQFFSRNIFLEKLGDEFIGTVETLKSILQFLNLSELGIGAAVGFSLYKPIFDNNREKINEIIGYLGFLYKRIGLFVLVSGLILMLFFPYFFHDTTINMGTIIFLFIALLTSNLLSYFFAYYMFLLEADQKSYINITIGQSVFVLRLLLQCLVLLYFKDVYLWILLELLTPFIYIFILRKKIRQVYPWLNFKFRVTKEVRKNNVALLKKIKQISFHKLGTFVSNSTDNIVIYSLVSPAMVAFVGNYQMVMNNINLLVGKLFDGTNASVGNLVAENDLKNMMKVFWEFMALRFFIAGCTSILLYLGFDSLISLWLGDKYLLSNTILLVLIIIFFMLQVRQPVDSFKQAYGLYDDIWSPVIQSVINLVLSIIFVLKYGVIGVFLGTLISQFIIVMLWRPYYVFKYGFKINHFQYWKGFGFHLLCFAATYTVYHYISINLSVESSTDFLSLILKLLKFGVLFFGIYFAILTLFSRGFKNLLVRILELIKNKIK